MDRLQIGKRLRELRGFAPQWYIAKEIGIQPATYGTYERGERFPRPEVMERLADFYGRSVDEIFFASEVNSKHNEC